MTDQRYKHAYPSGPDPRPEETTMSDQQQNQDEQMQEIPVKEGVPSLSKIR